MKWGKNYNSFYQNWQQNKQVHWFSVEMPIVSGFVVPKMNSTSHVGNIRLLRPVVVNIERKEDNQAEKDHTKDAEEPKEILHLRSLEKISLTSRICFCIWVFIQLCSLSNMVWIFCQSASVTLTETYNLVGAYFRTLSIWVLMMSTLLHIVPTALSLFNVLTQLL